MTDVMQGLVSEAKKNRFSSLAHSLSDEDVVSVWDNVSSFVEKQMSNQKGVHIPGLGTFTFSQKKLDVGNNKFILIQRPVFILSEKFAHTHGLNYTKQHTTGQIPVVQLNFAALSYESPFDRDTVEACVKEVMLALARSVASKKNVEFTFCGIGRLQIRDSKVKMKFYKEFINSMDGSGRLVEALKDRPGTVDSVMSERSLTRATSNTLILPRIGSGGLALGPADAGMPTIREEGGRDEQLLIPDTEAAPITDDVPDPDPEDEIDIGMRPQEFDVVDTVFDDDRFSNEPKQSPVLGSRMGSRMAVTMAKASGVNFTEDFLPERMSPKGMRGSSAMAKSSPNPLRRSLSPIHLPHSATPHVGVSPKENGEMPSFHRSQSVDRILVDKDVKFQPTPPPPKVTTTMKPPTAVGSACGHKDAGQELCYLCHQRERRNIPVPFTEERERREQEEDRLLQQFQQMKDSEAILNEQEHQVGKRHENQKMAAFNLGVAEAINGRKKQRPIDFHPSYIFQKRPLTPPRFIKQEIYHRDLADQVYSKDDSAKKRRADEEFLERLEQVQLAEDLAAQREQYLKDKAEQQELYKRALSAQIHVRDSLSSPESSPHIRAGKRLGPLTLPQPQILLPFSQTYTMAIQQGNDIKMVRFKPLPMPARVPDSSEALFGKFDMTNEAMADRRRHAHELYKNQLSTVEQRKRDAILRRLAEQREEETMLSRTKHELLEDRANRFERMYSSRKWLESNWASARDLKKQREHDEREQGKSPGALLHEQCDKYSRCGQCKRRVGNCGESNIWHESRYIPGSRLMV